MKLILKCFDIWNAWRPAWFVLNQLQGFQEATEESKKKKRGERLKTAGFLQPACLSSPSSPEGETFWQLPQDIIFTWPGQLLESPLAPRRAVSLSRLFFFVRPPKTWSRQSQIKNLLNGGSRQLWQNCGRVKRMCSDGTGVRGEDTLWMNCVRNTGTETIFFSFGMKH